MPREHEIRIEKIARLKELGIDPWPAMHPVTATCQQVIDEYKEGVEKHYSIAGRILAIRVHGKAAFATIQDRSGKIQVYLKSDHIGAEQFKILQELIDIGDIIWCDGTVFKTKTGEITLNVQKFDLLSKCLYPLPEKFHGISDIEIKYRQRYLDLISSEDTRDRFKKRSKIIGSIRSFLNSHEFVEVETPMLHPIAGGAAARPFVTHHNALDMNFYLRIAPELYLKRLVIGGFERVFEINRSFRNEGVSTRHNPEFTMVEFYMAHEDYNYAMNLVENLIRDMVEKVVGQSVIDFGQYKLDFSKPFQRLTLKESIMQYADIPLTQLEGKELDKILTKHNVVLENPNASEGQRLFALFEELVEKRLIQPTFILDYPIEISPLAKRDPRNKAYAARFELFIAGMEISNGFNELNDPFDQAQRFHDQVKAYEAGDQEAHQYDADYVKALEYGLPPTVGVGIGIDRLVMLLTNTTSIKDVILFPALKKQAE
ncbi:lysine--tRNA ligase [Candidatus Dependentiae bacterium]|nr:lysine--tRNA ligase [Candidatus Dependentiae bacterium]